MTQLSTITVTDFRSIRGSVTIPLDAPVVLIHGQNGSGKTSLLSAIELGLTGHVPSLARADRDYISHLVHKFASNGRIVLEGTQIREGRLRTQIDVAKHEVSGDALLSPIAARFYSERCFLAQATLSRLLELYEDKDTRKSDSPLTKFVKDLLGLDHLDALIDGLYDAGDVRRFRSTVPLYWETRENIPALQKEVDRHQKEITEIVGMEADVAKRVAERLKALDLEPALTDDLPALLTHLAGSPEESQLQRFAGLRREIVVVRQQWRSTQSVASVQPRTAAEQQNAAAASALAVWRTSTGKVIEYTLADTMSLFPDMSPSASAGPQDNVTAAMQRVAAELNRCSTLLSRAVDDDKRLESIDRDIEGAKKQAAELEKQVLAQIAGAGQLAKALSDVLPHIHTDDCPVCGRDFREVSEAPLRVHVSAQITALNEGAVRLQALSQERATVAGRQAVAERERGVIVSRKLQPDARNALKARETRLKELNQTLAGLENAAAEGQRLMTAAATASRNLTELHAADQRITNIRETVTSFAHGLPVEPLGSGEALDAALDRLESFSNVQERALARRQSARREATADVKELATLKTRRTSIEKSVEEITERIAKLSGRKDAADLIIADARELAKRARDARTDIVRRVFNDELNAMWRDLFVRLAPEEPFVPAFALPQNSNGPVEAILETHHRSGEKGGNPRAMLSSGNLNTAALTLFLALHLSVAPTLPWLVIDDPVQSMDEVHIAQFAALLRTLSKVHKRKVIIAVHEKPLFDYLALELSPAFPTDKLITVELSRTATGNTKANCQSHFWHTDTAIAA
ncbi:chromosome segregation protein [Caballeronia temeraria]|uniref:Chromosome segregation protein n=1 Tax=Caballeronia temeraria TaxID=1777137 RepID=A0A158BZH9_9BURK|nr:AAA family ATPase [Caballeronia temeraria]SAK75046.1 chromosome segregation protein [Caballeronia temeraria]